MDPYHDYVLEKIKNHREITSAVIYDNLLEEYKDFLPSYQTVRLYVHQLREKEGLPAPVKVRQYMEVAETPLGFQAQVDMGQKNLVDANGKNVKIYIFAMVLSASRYKYVCFQTNPFSGKDFCNAHDKAFKFFGGRPTEIVYDQDRVMIVSENGGDIIYTEAFENYKNYVGFSVHLCRGYNPESKGKIEAVIKYVKNNFLSFRIFHGTDSLNQEGIAWLDRTGNGMIHETTKMVPRAVFAEERKLLKEAPSIGEKESPAKVAIVRKNNIVMYKQNRYQMPKGTYSPGKRVRLEINEDKNTVRFYEYNSDNLIEELPIASGTGKCVRNSHPEREKKGSSQDIAAKVMEGFKGDDSAKIFIDMIQELKPRYIRDQLSIILKLQEKFSLEELLKGISYCTERNLISAIYLRDTLEYFAGKNNTTTGSSIPLPIKYRLVVADERSLEVYSSLLNGGCKNESTERNSCTGETAGAQQPGKPSL